MIVWRRWYFSGALYRGTLVDPEAISYTFPKLVFLVEKMVFLRTQETSMFCEPKVVAFILPPLISQAVGPGSLTTTVA